ncbi:MAG TPA: hypothetical protein VMH79_13835 [Thermoanaerobaculia bacterium]|nr:hypothetical protein [Thermoanaerobaculia bacterium]
MPRIGFSEIPSGPESVPFSSDSTVARLSPGVVTLHFRLVSADERSLEALRYARRAMLREESTRGVADDEPSLEEAVFSAFDVVWSVPPAWRAACRAKLRDLVARANRVLADESESRRASRTAPRPRTP